jgi:hypothetical protein
MRETFICLLDKEKMFMKCTEGKVFVCIAQLVESEKKKCTNEKTFFTIRVVLSNIISLYLIEKAFFFSFNCDSDWDQGKVTCNTDGVGGQMDVVDPDGSSSDDGNQQQRPPNRGKALCPSMFYRMWSERMPYVKVSVINYFFSVIGHYIVFLVQYALSNINTIIYVKLKVI